MWNRIEHGDNLDIMRTLPSESIDLIYCDILYGTGRDFGDYKDLPAKRDVIEAFYRPRLQEMHRLLKDSGSIYLQMDSRINHWIRCLMDEVFEYRFFRNEISWCYSGGGIPKNDFPRKHDILLRYTKTDVFTFNVIFQPYTQATLQRGRTQCKGKYFQHGFRDEGTPINDWWVITPLNSQANERIQYFSQKPEALLKRIIKASSNEGDLVADFFCGSGTTPAVAKRLNRQYFACDISERAVEITRKRLDRVEPERQQELFVNEAGTDNNAFAADKDRVA